MPERQSIRAAGATSASGSASGTWHYEYTIGRMLHHFDAESFEACLSALRSAITRSPQLTGIKVFESGRRSDAFDREMRETNLLAG